MQEGYYFILVIMGFLCIAGFLGDIASKKEIIAQKSRTLIQEHYKEVRKKKEFDDKNA